MFNHESGLEVASHHQSRSGGLEVIPNELESIPTALDSWHAIHGPSEKEGQQPQADTGLGAEPSSSGPANSSHVRKTRRFWIISLIVLILLVVAATLGGVLGSRARNQAPGTSDTSNSLPNPGEGNSSTPLTIRNNSMLSITGHLEEDGGWTARLVFEGPDGKLRFLDRSGPDGFWSAVTILDRVPLAPNGSFTISTYLIGGLSAPQYQLYYATTSGQMCGQVFKNGSTPIDGSPDSINALNFTAPDGTSMASYFPYIMVQDQASNQMMWYGYKYQIQNGYFDLTAESQPVLASSHTSMVVLPVNAWMYENINITLLAGFFYRTMEGTLAFALGQPTVPGDHPSFLLWNTTAGGFPNVSLPEGGAISGFASGRVIRSEQVDTHLLYQDGNGTIQVLWQENGKDWQGPTTFDAFDGADMGTSIACLTLGAYSRDGGMHVNVPSNSDTNRCYFQSQGGLKEVWYDGYTWRDCGFIATG
ncbi:hypothetical protein PFICI_13220 [Pestalotiopsis fici W106-1]|uniref:Fucose-specific lectin n=1 Tax=Pestalotiopsis fici (strain W106-1 / CGMCC3.15140) TaxID=1229662 RepID=W3WPK0_PESFW|nr:uncharacterized protein PFICI_13220 [Pestalotiopsis fici W106-1]ETS74736.1 hypothetical protein PFICI_13220 [Pestalotiopsis fici W106-1]